MPINDLVCRLDFASLVSVASAHGLIAPGGQWTLDSIASELISHRCWLCARVFPSFRIDIPALTSLSSSGSFGSPSRPQVTEADPVTFPPCPLSVNDKLTILRDWHDTVDVPAICEKPCAVCARLTLDKDISTVPLDTVDVSALHRAGEFVTRIERRSIDDAIEPVVGPVLYAPAVHVVGGVTFVDVCESCRTALDMRRGLPKEALANGLWVGDIPSVLRELTFVEQMLVAKVRHNSFVVKVNKGQRKMIANTIAFAQPLEKVYSVLPPPRDELDDVLAILFTGPCRPTEEDFKRTPLLVRHAVVLAALNWLVLNHCDYAGVFISRANLATYPENEPPVTVLRRLSDGTTPAESMSVHEVDEERGTVDGPCPFVVCGLSAADIATM
ncbi:uncharacterized protein LAESUDRAFT_650128, partial [Laetiporus sulphureus 93-53]